MNLEEQRGAGTDGAHVILQMRAIRRPHLAQDGAAAHHDVGDPELAADLDELAAGDDDLLAVGQGFERQQNGCRVVVDDQRVLGAGQSPQQLLDVRVPRAALLGDEIEFEVGVAFGDAGHALEGERAERRAAEIGVEHDASCVDHRPQRERAPATDVFEDASGQGVGIRRLGLLAQHAPPLGLEHLAHERGQSWPGHSPRFRPIDDLAQHLVHRGKPAEARGAVTAHRALPRPFRADAR